MANKPLSVANNRIIVEAAQRFSRRHGVSYAAYSDDWIIVLEQAGRRHVICGYALGLNTDTASSAANDKVATYLLLAAASLASVPHYLLSTAFDARIDHHLLRGLFAEHGELVVKPLRGSHGELVARRKNITSALEYMHKRGEWEWAASPFIDVEYEVRFVVFNNAVCLAYQKTDPVLKDGLKLFNLSHGAQAKVLDVTSIDPRLKQLAVQSMGALGLRLGAVDIVLDTAGTARVLEINSHFSLDHFAGTSASNKARVLELYEMVLGRLFGLR